MLEIFSLPVLQRQGQRKGEIASCLDLCQHLVGQSRTHTTQEWIDVVLEKTVYLSAHGGANGLCQATKALGLEPKKREPNLASNMYPSLGFE